MKVKWNLKMYRKSNSQFLIQCQQQAMKSSYLTTVASCSNSLMPLWTVALVGKCLYCTPCLCISIIFCMFSCVVLRTFHGLNLPGAKQLHSQTLHDTFYTWGVWNQAWKSFYHPIRVNDWLNVAIWKTLFWKDYVYDPCTWTAKSFTNLPYEHFLKRTHRICATLVADGYFIQQSYSLTLSKQDAMVIPITSSAVAPSSVRVRARKVPVWRWSGWINGSNTTHRWPGIKSVGWPDGKLQTWSRTCAQCYGVTSLTKLLYLTSWEWGRVCWIVNVVYVYTCDLAERFQCLQYLCGSWSMISVFKG